MHNISCEEKNTVKKNYPGEFFNGYKLILLSIFILGLFLRLYGSYPGYPQTNADESTIQSSANRMAFHENYEPVSYYYGSFLPLFYSITFKYFYMPVRFPQFFLKNASFLRFGPFIFYDKFIDDLERGINLTKLQFYDVPYWSRYNTAILSSFSVLLIFILSKRLFNTHVGLAAAFLTAVNLRHVISSKLALADAPTAVFILLALIAFSNLIKNNSYKNYLLSGIAIALALSVKYFIYVVPAFVLCHLLSVFDRRKSITSQILNFFSFKKIILATVVAIFLFVIFNPYLFIKHNDASAQLAYNAARYNLGLSWESLTSRNIRLFPLYYMYYFGLTPILSIATLAGFFYCLIRYPKNFFIISSVVVPYVYLFYVVSGTGLMRNYSSIIPLALIYPSVLLTDFARLISKITQPRRLSKNLFNFALVLLALIFGFSSFKNSLINSYYFSKENSLTSLYNYLGDYVPEHSKIFGMNAIFYPSKSFEIENISASYNLFVTLDEIKNSNNKWAVLGFDSTATVFEGLLADQIILKKGFFNQDLLWKLYGEHYQSLAFNQLADYRVAEFIKPESQDPQFIVVKFPEFYKAIEENNIASFKFDKKEDLNSWREEFYPANSYEVVFNSSEGITRSGTIQINADNKKCLSNYYKISSNPFKTESDRWITLTAIAKRKTLEEIKIRNGFFRIDFYDKDKQIIKTYLTKPLSKPGEWEKLVASGQSPKETTFAKVSFVIDACIEYESYLLDEVNVFSSQNPNFDLKDYPYYDKSLPRDVLWTPPL